VLWVRRLSYKEEITDVSLCNMQLPAQKASVVLVTERRYSTGIAPVYT
jgi:hypothetical protein